VRARGGGGQADGRVHLHAADARATRLRDAHRTLDGAGEERQGARAARQAGVAVGMLGGGRY